MSRDAEDFEAIESQRLAAERMCGWNGSLELWSAPAHRADPMPPEVRAKLASVRESAALRHQQRIAKGWKP